MRHPALCFLFCFAVLAALPAASRAADGAADRPVALQPPSHNAEDVFSSLDSTPLGLRPPPVQSLRDRIDLPMGMHYNRNARSLLMPLDDKSEWGFGINLNVAAPPTEFSSPGLQIAPKRTPGLTLQRNF